MSVEWAHSGYFPNAPVVGPTFFRFFREGMKASFRSRGVKDSEEEAVQGLVTKARDGDPAAMTELFDRYRDRLSRMVRLRIDRRVQGRVDESDVLQDAYVDLVNQLPNYARSPKLPFYLWLRRITGQRLAKIHRFHLGQQKRDPAREVSLVRRYVPDASSVYMADVLLGQFTSPSNRVMRHEVQQQVQSEVEQLTDIDREIIALRYVEQMSNAEVALELDLTEDTARKRHTRAIRHLREALKRIPGALD